MNRRLKVSRQDATPAVARRAGLQLRLGVFALQSGQSVPMVAVPKQRFTVGQFDVQTARTVTGFAADIDFRKRCVILGRLRIEVPLQIRGVTVGAHRLPALGHTGPMQRVVRFQLVIDVGWTQIEPAFFDRVPADPQHLQSCDFVGGHLIATVEFDHVLLQRFDAKHILDLEVLHLARLRLRCGP